MRKLAAFILPMALLLASCSQAQTEQPQNLPRQTIIITPAGGEGAQTLSVQVAATESQRETGLMFVKTMPQSEGMLFTFPEAKFRSFWMHNTFIPLDIIYLRNNTVINVVPWAKPHDETPLPSTEPADTVLEVNGGWAARHNIGAGSILKIFPAK